MNHDPILDIQLVRKLMSQYNLTQRELAGMAGVTEAAMSRYLAGERQPRADKIANMATALHTTSDALLGKEESLSDLDRAVRLVARNAGEIPDSVKRRLIRLLVAPIPGEKED